MAVCYVDIDHFKPFNDVYGYAKGDQVLLTLAQCLTEHIDPAAELVGHIGGDDFLLVLSHADWQRRLHALQSQFAQRCQRLYRAEDVQTGYFMAANRKGTVEPFGLLSLSIGVFVLHPKDAEHYDAARLAECASRAKQIAKANHQTHFCVLDSRSLCVT